MRIPRQVREDLLRLQSETAGPSALGPWLLWAAQRALPVLPRRDSSAAPARSNVIVFVEKIGREWTVLRADAGAPKERLYVSHARTQAKAEAAADAFAQAHGFTRRRARSGVVLDLCGGSGAWSEPYKSAGYDVRIITLPAADVRTWQPSKELLEAGAVRGVLAAPPCTEFSIAKNGRERDLAGGLEAVCACLRIIALVRPVWWALENPTGLLGRWLGTPRDVFEPHEFGDPWTKRTALWGDFEIPERGPFVQPIGSAMDRKTPAEQAITPPGFARAFYEANP